MQFKTVREMFWQFRIIYILWRIENSQILIYYSLQTDNQMVCCSVLCRLLAVPLGIVGRPNTHSAARLERGEKKPEETGATAFRLFRAPSRLSKKGAASSLRLYFLLIRLFCFSSFEHA